MYEEIMEIEKISRELSEDILSVSIYRGIVSVNVDYESFEKVMNDLNVKHLKCNDDEGATHYYFMVGNVKYGTVYLKRGRK